MATQRYDISSADGWVEVVDSVSEFLMENKSQTTPVLYRFDTSAPAADAPGHTLYPRSFAVRADLTGAVYVRTDSEKDVGVVVTS